MTPHRDAWVHVQYRADNHPAWRYSVYNARAGRAPTTITLPDGSTASHLSNALDDEDLQYVPQVGDWVLIDLTEERADVVATWYAERWWNSEDASMRYVHDAFSDVEEFRAHLHAYYLDEVRRGAPDLVQVDEELAAQHGWVAQKAGRR